MKKKIKYESTINHELLNAWKMQYRTGDVKELMKLSNRSYPVVQRAIMFGYVKNDELCNIISNYYLERAKKQKQQAKTILTNL